MMDELKSPLRSPALSPARSPALSPNRSPNRSPNISPGRSPSRSPKYGSPPHGRHRSASIPVTPEALRGVRYRFLNINALYPLGEQAHSNLLTVEGHEKLGHLPRSAPELTVDEVGPSVLSPWSDDPSEYATSLAYTVQRPAAETLSRRFSETLTVSESRSRRRKLKGSVSPNHRRSLSFRAARKRSRPVPCDDQDFRPRGNSVPCLEPGQMRHGAHSTRRDRDRSVSPNPGLHYDLEDDDNFYMLRNFTITPKGSVVNRGDLYRHKSRSNNSVASTGSSVTGGTGASTATSCSSGPHALPPKRVLMLGAIGVGKTALVTQFMSSEYMNAYDCSMEEDLEKNISILLDGEEYELTFVDPQINEDISADDSLDEDAYVVVYSITDRATFEKAVDILFKLREKGHTVNKAVILVGNKSDLVRSRLIKVEEGKSVACTYECKFTETSAAINHQVDELLVGIVTQMRLKAKQQEERNSFCATSSSHKRMSLGGTTQRARGFINRLLGKGRMKSQSCGNLHVL